MFHGVFLQDRFAGLEIRPQTRLVGIKQALEILHSVTATVPILISFDILEGDPSTTPIDSHDHNTLGPSFVTASRS